MNKGKKNKAPKPANNQTASQRAKWLYKHRTEPLVDTDYNGTPCRKWIGGYRDKKTRYSPKAVFKEKEYNAVGFMLQHIGGVSQPAGTVVCHNCSTKGCAEWRHVYFGTHKENMHDMIRSGTHKYIGKSNKGKNHPRFAHLLNKNKGGKYDC